MFINMLLNREYSDDDQELVPIKSVIPDAIIDLKYYSDDNFTNKILYDDEYDILRSGTLKKLKAAAQELRKSGYLLVIWDAYRPLHIQTKLWDSFPDPDFVAHPSKGSMHNKGCAVDVCLADLKGNILDMPSDFDDFSESSSAVLDFHSGSKRKNLSILQESMTGAGFLTYENEWWHFYDSEWEKYDIIR